MRKSVAEMVKGKVRLGRMAMPVWGVALGVAVIAAAAGQAVGPVLSGSTTGSVNLTVSQAVTLDTTMALGSNPGFSSTADSDVNDGASTRNDEGTNFTVAIEMAQGDEATVALYLENHSGKNAAAVLELNVPAGIDVYADSSGDVNEAQLGPKSWLLNVQSAAGTGDDDRVILRFEPKDDLAPGFYTITGRIAQISG